MGWTQADIDALKAAIASNGAVQSVTIAGQQMTFRSMDDMLKLLALMQGEVNQGARGHRLAATSKGA